MNMKTLATLAALLITGRVYLFGQGNTGGISANGVVPVAVAPSGNCGQGSPGRLVTTTGAIWTCQNITAGIGTWSIPPSSGGPPTPLIQSNSIITEGDSITAGTGASGACNGTVATGCYYAALLAYDANATLTNRGIGGDLACDVADLQTVKNDTPTLDKNALYTLMVGTNDANTKGVGTYETGVYKPCHQASLAWIATANKMATSACTTTGTWAAFSGYALAGQQSTTNGSTMTCTLKTYGSPLYAWYRLKDSDGGTFTYAVDGGSTTSLTTATTPAIATQNGGTTGWGLIRVTGLVAGSHNIVFTVTSATSASNTVTPIAVGTLTGQTFYNQPNLFAGGVPKQDGDGNAVATAAYNADALSDATLLSGDGLPIKFVDVRGYLCTQLGGGSCENTSGTADMSNFLHPNNVGHNDLKQAWENQMQFSSNVTTIYPINVGSQTIPTDISGYSNVNKNGLFSTTGVGQGLLWYLNRASADADGVGLFLDPIRGVYANTLFSSTEIQHCFFSSSLPTGPSSLTCPLVVNSNGIVGNLTASGSYIAPSFSFGNSSYASIANYPTLGRSNLSSTTALNAGVTLFNNGTANAWGIDFGYDSGTSKYETRMFAPSGNGEHAFCFFSTYPTAQSNFTCPSWILPASWNLGLGVKSAVTHGSNATVGVVTLSGGTALVTTNQIGTLATAGGSGDVIILSCANFSSTACGTLSFGAIVSNVGFNIASTNATDTVYWEIKHVN